jgi:3-deoxy-manno-octulosonate cytidylyltransferase (CMP-KDO synthetase)
MKILGVIPARYASTRFPGKPLADIAGKSMIERVYREVMKSTMLSRVLVATDHPAIFNHVKSFGGKVFMTSESHPSGTDRCFETLSSQEEKFDYVINIQGDEPFIAPEQIDLLAQLLDGKTELATLIKKIDREDELFNPNVVKVVKDDFDEAIYFSRSPIPHVRNTPQQEWLAHHSFFKHIGMYAYRHDILAKITKLEISSLERTESLEQLRWIENGYSIKVAETTLETMGIDTPEDLEKAIQFVNRA